MAQLGPYEVHPVASEFPLVEGTEYEDLKQDIKQNGLLEPITTDASGMALVDGRNRYRACHDLSMPAPTVALPEDYTEEDVIRFIISKNLRRRNLTVGQRAALVKTALERLKAEARKRSAQAAGQPRGTKQTSSHVADLPHETSTPVSGRSRDKAATMLGVSGRAVQSWERVEREAPDLAARVKAGELALDAADKEIRRRAESGVEGAWEDPFKGWRAPSVRPLTHTLKKQRKTVEGCLAMIEGALQTLTSIEEFRKDTPAEELQAWSDRIQKGRYGGIFPDLRKVQQQIKQRLDSRSTND